jgi:hypothetical protein
MVCLLASAASASTFVGMTTSASRLPPLVKLRGMLNEKQKQIMEDIVRERAQRAMEGLLAGLAVALPLALARAWCAAAVAVLVVQSAYYGVAPKSKWLLNHLDTREQIDTWLEVYKSFKVRGITTAVSGAVAYLVVCTLLGGLRSSTALTSP